MTGRRNRAARVRLRRVWYAGQSADAQAAVRGRLKLVQRKGVHIYQVAGRFNLQLHQVQQVGTACNKAGAWIDKHCGGCL